MVEKVIKPIDGAARSAAVSKYSSDRQGRERGREQQFSDSCKPKVEKKEAGSLDKFFASDSKKSTGTASEFERLLRKVWEDNIKMQESAKALEQTPADFAEVAYIMGINSTYRPIIKK